MKRTIAFLVLVLLTVAGCKKDSNPITPTPTEDWTFPASASKFGVTVYSGKTTVAVGQTFDVKVILYNVSHLFGGAVSLHMSSDTLALAQFLEGPVYSSTVDPIYLGISDTLKNEVDYGITLRAGTATAFSGSAVLFKLKVQAKKAGPFVIRVLPQTLALQDSTGAAISGFGTVALESLAMTAN